MENGLQKRYGLVTAMAMVVGIVVGSGVFFKAEKVLNCTGGDLKLGIFAWVIGGIIMISCAYSFAVMAARYEKINGIVDYAEAALGPKYSYTLGWILTVVYYPNLTAVLAWVSARYTCVLFGVEDITGGICMVIACFYLVLSYALNALSPVLAGKFQVCATVIKLIPLLLMAVAGTVFGLKTGMTSYNFTNIVTEVSTGTALFTAVVATAFAYDGWIVATSINSEIKDSKKNLPRALVGGTFIIMAVYILYYVGLAGAVTNEEMMAGGEAGARLAFETVFSSVGGTLVFVFVIISCLGTLNGVMLACTRGIYSLSARGKGPRPDMFGEISPTTNMPTNSAIFGVLLAAFWLLYFYGANLTTPWFGFFSFDSSELPIVAVYGMYIPIFFKMMTFKDLTLFKRVIAPSVAVCGCIFMVVAACFSHRGAVIAFLIVLSVITLIGMRFSKERIEK
ncbi:MAG: APC family permease [Firmicutes bacterium]|nr:APC family permease [Bacillota bacterium]